MPLFSWLSSPLARVALAIAMLAITVLAFAPAPTVPMTTSWDKLDHWFAFFTLALLADHAFPRASFWTRLALALLAYGIAIEIFQWFIPGREASVLDVLADSVGIACYGGARQWLAPFLRSAPAG